MNSARDNVDNSKTLKYHNTKVMWHTDDQIFNVTQNKYGGYDIISNNALGKARMLMLIQVESDLKFDAYLKNGSLRFVK